MPGKPYWGKHASSPPRYALGGYYRARHHNQAAKAGLYEPKYTGPNGAALVPVATVARAFLMLIRGIMKKLLCKIFGHQWRAFVGGGWFKGRSVTYEKMCWRCHEIE